jgi:hypothetical protein
VSEVHVRLAIGGVSLEFRGSRSFFDREVEPLLRAAYVSGTNGATPYPAAETDVEGDGEPFVIEVPVGPSTPRPEPEGWRPSSPHFSQFIQQVGPRAATADQQLMAFGFFLWNYERIETFGVDEIRGCFEVIGLPTPADLSSRLERLCEKKRFLEPVPDDQFQLTTKGRNYVKNRLLSSV